MLQPTVRRSWAPRGQTPIHRTWDRRDRLSAISAITVSPRSRRLGLYFDVLTHNVRTEHFAAFMAWLLRRTRRRLVVVLDRLNVHRAAARELRARYGDRIHFEWLPPYAPDLNPDEQVWNRAKYTDLANYIPDNITALGHEVVDSFRRTSRSQQLLRSFFNHARLPL